MRHAGRAVRSGADPPRDAADMIVAASAGRRPCRPGYPAWSPVRRQRGRAAPPEPPARRVPRRWMAPWQAGFPWVAARTPATGESRTRASAPRATQPRSPGRRHTGRSPAGRDIAPSCCTTAASCSPAVFPTLYNTVCRMNHAGPGSWRGIPGVADGAPFHAWVVCGKIWQSIPIYTGIHGRQAGATVGPDRRWPATGMN